MIPQTFGDGSPTETRVDALMREMLETQLLLGDSIKTTSQFLQFVLTLTNENLCVIQQQLEKIRNLANAINNCDHTQAKNEPNN